MCGRYTVKSSGAEIAAEFDARWRNGASHAPSYNIAPTQHAPVLLQEGGERVLDAFRWGLIPSWAKSAEIGNRMINARAETVASKPAYRVGFRERRCLVPADGYYEWQKVTGGKQPQWIHPAEGGLLTFAGIWESWRPDPGAEPVETFTVLTTSASEDLRSVHDRMPVLVEGDARIVWLSADTRPAELQEVLRPAPVHTLAYHPVDRRVGNPRFNEPVCIAPLIEDNLAF